MAIGRLFAHREAFYGHGAENLTNPQPPAGGQVDVKGQRVCVCMCTSVSTCV